MENNLIYVNNSIFTKTPHIYLNLNTSIEKNLYVSKNAEFKENLIIRGNLSVLGDSVNIISEKTVIGDPLVVFGYNQIQTDNFYGGFIVNYNSNNKNYYSGLIRQPSTKNFHLYHNINSNINTGEPILEFSNTDYSNLFVNNINVESDINLKHNFNGPFYQFNNSSQYFKVQANTITQSIYPNHSDTYDIGSANLKYNNIFIKNNINLDQKTLKIKDNTINTDNLLIDFNITTTDLYVLNNSTFENDIKSNNNLFGQFYQFNNNSQYFKVEANTITQSIYPNHSDTYDIGSADLKYNDIYIKNNINLDEKTIFVKNNIINTDNLTIDKNIITSNIFVNNESTFLNNITVNNTITSPFFQFNRPNSEFTILGNSITKHILPLETSLYDLGSESKKFKSLYLSGNSLFLGNIHIKQKDGAFSVENIKVDKETETQTLSVKEESYFENDMTINNNILGKFYQFNNNSQYFKIEANSITQSIYPNHSDTYDIGSEYLKYNNIYVKNNINLDEKTIKVKNNIINTDNILIDNNITSTNIDILENITTSKLFANGFTELNYLNVLNNSTFSANNTFLANTIFSYNANTTFYANMNIQGNYNFLKWTEKKYDALGTQIPLPTDNLVVPITYGGTGSTNQKQLRENLFIKFGARGSSDLIQNSEYKHDTNQDVERYYFQPYSYTLSYIDYIYNKKPGGLDINWKPDEYKQAPNINYNHDNFGVLNMFSLHTWPGTPNLNTIQKFSFQSKHYIK